MATHAFKSTIERQSFFFFKKNYEQGLNCLNSVFVQNGTTIIILFMSGFMQIESDSIYSRIKCI